MRLSWVLLSEVLHFVAAIYWQSATGKYSDNTGLMLGDNAGTLLVAQRVALVVFELNGEGILRLEEVNRFAYCPAGCLHFTAAKLINNTHLIYCGERRCSICSFVSSSNTSCVHADFQFPVEHKVRIIGITVVNDSVFFARGVLTSPGCIATFVGAVSLDKNIAFSGSVLYEKVSRLSEWQSRKSRTWLFELFAASWLPDVLVSFEYGDHAFVLAKEVDGSRSNHLHVFRYDLDLHHEIIRRSVRLKCHHRTERASDCFKDSVFGCKGKGDYIANNYKPRSATVDGGSLFVIYDMLAVTTRVHLLCHFAINELYEIMKKRPKCTWPAETDTCLPPQPNFARSCYVETTEKETDVVSGHVFATFVDKHPAENLSKSPNGELAFYFTLDFKLCRIAHYFDSWYHTCFVDLSEPYDSLVLMEMYDARFRRRPAVAFDGIRNRVIFANGKQLCVVEMNCSIWYPKCTPGLTYDRSMGDDDCVWCARNGTSGYSVSFKQRELCFDGVIVVNVCPPRIEKVSRQGATYYIDGVYLDNFNMTAEGRSQTLSVHACGDVCTNLKAVGNWERTSFVCTTEPSYFRQIFGCNEITIRGRIRDSSKYEWERTRAQWRGSGRRPMTDRYHKDYNGMLTLVHQTDEPLAPYLQIRNIAVVAFALLLLLLVVVAINTSYVKVRQYRRRKEWETTGDKLEAMVEIDRGSFGVVFCAKHDGAWVAVKRLIDAQPGEHRYQFENEIWLLKTLGTRYRHPHMLRLLWVVLKPKIMIITELCHGSLYREIHEHKQEFASDTILDFCEQIASGMNFLHSKGVIHRDLKSGNILLADKDGTTLKICDFGLSNLKLSRLSQVKGGSYFVGSLLWMAPEILAKNAAENQTPYTFLSDVYAFGICVYELITSRLPYRDYADAQILWQVSQGKLRPDYRYVKEGRYSFALQTISQRCISYHASARPTFDMVSLTSGSKDLFCSREVLSCKATGSVRRMHSSAADTNVPELTELRSLIVSALILPHEIMIKKYNTVVTVTYNISTEVEQ